MSLSLNGNTLTVYVSWSEMKSLANAKMMALQYILTVDNMYQIFGLDGRILYRTNIYSGSYPSSIDGDAGDPPTSADNDAFLYDFETNFKSAMNRPTTPYQMGDSRWIFRLGNMMTTGSVEQLVAGNGYFEPQTQGQRSVVSTSVLDIDLTGTGARAVRITYLNSQYQLKVEDVALSGTVPVNTVNTDIKFIERFEVIRGTAAAGRIILRSGTATALNPGEICSIGAASTEAFLCHHYIPSGSQCEIIEWDVTASDDTLMRLKGQRWFSGSLVDPVYYDLENIQGLASGSTFNFTRKFMSTPAQEKTRVYVTAQSQQATQTTIRARLNLWQDCLYVSGTM